MNIGSLAGGLADGFTSGYRTGILGANIKGQQANDERRLKIAEEQNARSAELQGLQIQDAKRAMERQQALDAAHKQALQIMSGASGAQIDPNAPPDTQIARVMAGGFNDPRALSAAAQVYAQAGHPDAIKWFERSFQAKREGVLDFLDAVDRGNMDEAKSRYNSFGEQRMEAVAPVVGKDGKPTGRVRVKWNDGQEEEMDPDAIKRSVFSYSEWRNMQAEAQKAKSQADKDDAEIKLKKAQAEEAEGRNPTRIRVAEIGADRARSVASIRATASGGGRGSGRGAGKEPDVWKDAEQRNKVLKEVDDIALNQFGDPNPASTSGARQHNDKSRKVGRAAQMIFSQAVRDKNDNMTQDWAVKIAAEGTPSYEMPRFSNGRLVTKATITYDNVRYPMGTAVKPAEKEQVMEYLNRWASIHKQAERKPTEAQLRAEPEVKAAAKQAGMSVDDVVNKILGKEPPAKPATPAKPKAGITGSAEGVSKEDGGASASTAKRSGGIAGEIQALEDRLSAIPDNGALPNKLQRGKIQDEIDRLRSVTRNESNRGAVIPSQRVATAAKLRELEAQLANLKDDGRLSTSTRRGQLEEQIESLRSALRRSSGGGITREIR